MSGPLAGKVVVVTGASRGLGRHCALGYGAGGATVVVTGRSAEGVAGTAGAVEVAGGTALALACDVADPTSIAAMVDEVLSRFGHVDLLMANAGYFAPGTISTMTPEDWERQFRVNVHGVFYTARAVLPAMAARGRGTVLAISSVAAGKPSHYGVTKRAVEATVEAFAAEQAPHGVCIASLRPVAAIETPGWLAARDAATRATRAHRISPPDSYVAAAVLLAELATAEHAGLHFTDAEVIRAFAPGEYDRFAQLNAPVWSAG